MSTFLRSIDSEDKDLLQLAHQMDVEVAQLYPLHITALDIFNVDLSLIPKVLYDTSNLTHFTLINSLMLPNTFQVIETAITYNIIMFQFKASER